MKGDVKLGSIVEFFPNLSPDGMQSAPGIVVKAYDPFVVDLTVFTTDSVLHVLGVENKITALKGFCYWDWPV